MPLQFEAPNLENARNQTQTMTPPVPMIIPQMVKIVFAKSSIRDAKNAVFDESSTVCERTNPSKINRQHLWLINVHLLEK